MSWLVTILLVAHLAPAQSADEVLESARSLLEDGRSLEALQTIEAGARRYPESAALHHELGLLYAAAGRLGEALTSFERACELEPDNRAYAFAFGETLYRRGRAEDAVTFLEKAARPPEPIPEALLVLSGAYEKLGRSEDVTSTVARYLERNPDDDEVRVLLGEKLEAAQRFHEALELYRAGLERDEDHPILLHRTAAILGRRRETYEEAESYVRKALDAAPDFLDSRLLLARLLERTGREKQALAELESARSAHRQAPRLYYALAQAYQRAGRAEEARAAAEKFQSLSATERKAEEREARVAVTYKKAVDLLSRGEMLEAESVFRSVLEIDPDNAPARSMLAKIAFSKGEAASALRFIGQAIEKDPSVGEYHYLSALFRARTGAPAKAEPAVRRSLELDPGFPDAWSLLGSILLDSGRAEEAVDCFLKAAALEPENATIQLNLASAYAAIGNEFEEQAAMERYRELSRHH